MRTINLCTFLNKKIIFSIFILVIMSVITTVYGAEFYDSNKPGISYGSGSSGSGLTGSSTKWPNPYLNSIRVRVFRGSSQLYETYFTLSNSSSKCYGSVSNVKICTTKGYNYSSINSINDATCTNSTSKSFSGCLYGSGLGDTWDVDKSNGTNLSNYLKNNNYANLKSVLKQMGYTESNYRDSDIVIIEPTTLVKCAGTLYFGTANALKAQNVSYNGSNGNKCAANDNVYNGYKGYTFQQLYRSMSHALKETSSACNTSSSDKSYSGCGYFRYNVKDFAPPIPKYNLTITKYDGSNKKSNVKFTITGNGVNKSCTTALNGSCVISDLVAGTYTVTETVPASYDASKITCNGCSSINRNVFTVVINGNKSITITNRKTCQSEFDALSNKSDKAARVALYQKYGFTNLLNFGTNTNVCTNNTNCTSNIAMGCLSAKDNSGFNANNLSCYNETITVGGQTGYCRVTFNLNNTISGFNSTYSFGSNFKAGQMVLNRNYQNSIIAMGILTKSCYVYGSGIGSTVSGESNQSYSNYIGNLYLDRQKLSNTSENSSGWVKANVSGGSSFTKTLSMSYRLKPVYSDLGTGKLSYSKCSTTTNRCRLLGYGFASKLDAKVNQTISVPYSINISIPKTKVGTTNGKCTYRINDNRITTTPDNPSTPSGGLNIEFRPIETDNAFPGKKASGRIVGDNWRSKNFDLDGNRLVNQNDITKLRSEISKGATDLKYDINKDGKVDNKDVELLNYGITKYKVSAGENKMSTNPFIKYIMETTNNSYDKNKTGPIYKITLNSDTINKIRKYNETKNYDDYTLECKEDGYDCKSTFLKQFGIKRLK